MARRNNANQYSSMELTKAALAAAQKIVPALKDYGASFYGEHKSVPVVDIGVDGLKALAEYYEGNGDKQRAAQALSFAKVLESPDKVEVGRLRMLEPAIRSVLGRLPKRWIYKRNEEGLPLAYLVTGVAYHEGTEQTPASVSVSLKCYRHGVVHSDSIGYLSGDLRGGKTVTQALLDNGYFLQNALLDTQYGVALAKYEKWWSLTGVQFRAKGSGVTGRYDRDRHVLGAGGAGEKVVADYQDAEADDQFVAPPTTGESWGAARGDDDETTKDFPLPIHPYLNCFHLEMHEYMWIHVNHLKEYVYQPELKEKLILPADMVELIDVLTADVDVLKDDIIEGKTGGTTVLCKGDPGVGKTLTAEVYCEVIKRPLYKLHSGQLGTDPEKVEEELKAALHRGERWKAVMLIDEADVYLQARASNLEQNAVVGVFLRTLEYFNGLLFLTTNRSMDIDDAILSRCMAVIDYPKPDEEGRRRLWKVLSKQFGVTMSDKLIDSATKQFDDIAGRDIKAFLRLASKWLAAKKVQPSMEVLHKAALFRGYKHRGKS